MCHSGDPMDRAQDDGTGMTLLRYSRGAFRRIGKGLGRSEQSDNRRSAGEFGLPRCPTPDASESIPFLLLGDDRGGLWKHVMSSFPGRSRSRHPGTRHT